MLKAIPGISKKILVVLIGVVLVASMSLFISPGKIYGISDPVTNVTKGTSHETIQEAIDAASAGDTITVAAGTYNYASENPDNSPAGMIHIDKGITLKAADGATPVLDGSGGDGVIKIWPQALEDGFPVVVEGFEIIGGAATDIAITGRMYDSSTDDLIIRNNIIHGMNAGIDFWGSSGGKLKNIEITDNKFYDLGKDDKYYGIMLERLATGDGYAAVIKGNEFYNIDSGFGVIITGDSANVLVENNNFELTVTEYGVAVQDVVINGPADARNNWWGDNSGPSGGVADPVTGTIANGSGGKVSENVRFDPWTTHAGPPPKPLTPEEQVSLELSIQQQVSLYGANNVGFTKMLYDNILGRVPDSEGENNWVTALNEGSITLGDVIFGFVFSQELESIISPAGPDEFITFLYKNVLNRDPDPDGYDNWITHMNAGMSKEEVLLHFVDSDEFRDICDMFGLKP